MPELLNQVAQIMTYSMAPDSTLQKQAYDALEQHSANPEFARYLAFVFAKGTHLAPGARAVAGLTLKRMIDKSYERFSGDVANSVKAELLFTLADADASVRAAGANAIATIVRKTHLQDWPSLVPALIHLLDQGEQLAAAADGALSALTHLSEDVGGQFDSDKLGRPLDVLIPKLIGWMGHAQPQFRRAAAAAMSNFIIVQPSALQQRLGPYMEALAKLTADNGAGIRKVVAESLAHLSDIFYDQLRPHMGSIMAFELRCLLDADQEVALAASDFWSSLVERVKEALRQSGPDYDEDGEYIGGGQNGTPSPAAAAVDSMIPLPVMSELIKACLARMAYSNDDIAAMPAEDLRNDSSLGEDKAQDMRPHIQRTKESSGAGTASGGQPEDDEDEDDGACLLC